MPGPEKSETSNASTSLVGGEGERVIADNPSLGFHLLAASPDWLQLLDTAGTVRFVNSRGARLVELDDPSTVIGHDWLALWPPATVAKASKALDEAREGTMSRFSGLCPTAKGTPKWWEVSLNPIRDDNGDIAWILAIGRDITSQKFAEKALRVSEDRFRALADNIAQFAWMADPTGYIFWFNQRTFDYTGQTFDQMAGFGWKAVHHPAHVERVTEKYSACIASGEIWEDTFPLRGADGNYRWFLSRAMPIRDENGKVTLWCGTNTDITDQRNASQRLRQMARLVELSHEAILVRSPDQGIVLWNRGCEDLYGYSQAEAIGREPNALLKTSSSVSPTDIHDILLREGSWSGELERRAKDGTVIWVDCRKQILRMGDEYVILETDHDITGRKRADDVRTLLISELNHRVKNTLAIVQSIAAQTARKAGSMREFIASFNGRLQSLSSAHNVLTDRNWSGACIHDLVTGQLEVVAGDRSRVTCAGPDLYIPAQLSLQLTLILHELATNAVKHGALSAPCGKVTIEWDIDPETPTRLALVWTEAGGPPVAKPQSQGFGLSLIERSSRLPQIDADVRFEEPGLVARIVCDLDVDDQSTTKYFNPATRKAVSLS